MALTRSTLLCLVIALVAVFVLATPIQTLAAKRLQAQADYVISLQRCKGSQTWTLHGLWPEWGQDCKGPVYDDKLNDPIRAELKQDWLSCPEYGKTNEQLWEHEHDKHARCYRQRWNATQLAYFQKSLDLLHELRPRCSPSLTGECRIKLDANFKPLN